MSSTDSITSSVAAPAAVSQRPSRTSPTSFTRLFLEHTRLAEQAGYQSKGVENELNQLGADGWEVVAVTHDVTIPTVEYRFVLKRAKK